MCKLQLRVISETSLNSFTLTGLVGEETTSFGPTLPYSRAFQGSLPWPAAPAMGLDGCWSEVLSAGPAWAVPSGCMSGLSWGWCLWPLEVPEDVWAGKGSSDPSKSRCVLLARLWRERGVWNMGVSGSWLGPLLGAELTWALLNSDNTLEVWKQIEKQRDRCDNLMATIPTVTVAVVKTKSHWLLKANKVTLSNHSLHSCLPQSPPLKTPHWGWDVGTVGRQVTWGGPISGGTFTWQKWEFDVSGNWLHSEEVNCGPGEFVWPNTVVWSMAPLSVAEPPEEVVSQSGSLRAEAPKVCSLR